MYFNIFDTAKYLEKCIELAKDYLRRDPKAYSTYEGLKHSSDLRRISLEFNYNDEEFKPIKKFESLYILYDYNELSDTVTLIRLSSYRQIF